MSDVVYEVPVENLRPVGGSNGQCELQEASSSVMQRFIGDKAWAELQVVETDNVDTNLLG